MNKANNEQKKKVANKNPKSKKNVKKKKKRSFLKFLLKLLLLILFIISVVGGVLFYKIEKNGGGIKGALITVLGLSQTEINNLRTINVLVLGVSEDIEATLTDTIVVCSYNPYNQKSAMISIPRDTFIGKNKENAKGTDKINSLYTKDPKKLLNKVSEIMGIPLNYYAVVNTQALVKIIDVIGGVDFDVPIDMDYDDKTQDLHIHLKSGMQRIDGEKAEQLLRFRHNNDGSSYPANYGDNDFGRMKTQRAFVLETLKQTINIKNLNKAQIIIDTIFENIETNLTIDILKAYIPTAIDFNLDSITSKQLPGKSEKCNDLWFFIYDELETNKMIRELNL